MGGKVIFIWSLRQCVLIKLHRKLNDELNNLRTIIIKENISSIEIHNDETKDKGSGSDSDEDDSDEDDSDEYDSDEDDSDED